MLVSIRASSRALDSVCSSDCSSHAEARRRNHAQVPSVVGKSKATQPGKTAWPYGSCAISGSGGLRSRADNDPAKTPFRLAIDWTAKNLRSRGRRRAQVDFYLAERLSSRSMSASISAPARTTMQVIPIHVMKPTTAPSEP